MGKSSTKAKNKYNAKAYDRISVNVKKGTKDEWRSEAEKQGVSLNAFICKAVSYMIENTPEKRYNKLLAVCIEEMNISIRAYKIKALSPTVLQQFITDKFNEGYSRNTLSVIKGILSNSLNYAIEPLKYIESNPMLYVKLPSKRAVSKVPTRSAPHVYIPKEKMDDIFKRFPEGTSTHLPIMLGYKCGLRLGEAFGLTWEDINFEKCTLTVNRQVQWHEKESPSSSGYWYFSNPKYDSFRTIAIDNELLELLKRAKDKSERAKIFYDDMYVYNYESEHLRKINTLGNGCKINLINVRDSGEFIQPRTMQHTSNIIHTKLNYPEFDFHSLRHTHCSMLLEAGASSKYVQERLGHKNIQVTMQIYKHLTESMSKQGNDILNKIF